MADITNGEYSVSALGAIRVETLVDNHTVLEMHRWLQDLADDDSETSDDFMSIVRKTPSIRSTDNIITLVSHGDGLSAEAPKYNIDDATSETLFDGSIIQNDGDDVYDGIVNFGNTIHIILMQDGAALTNDFWNLGAAGINEDVAAGKSHQFLVKVRSGGTDIDGKRFTGLTREFNRTYSEFGISSTANGNNVLALSDQVDLNNQTAQATVAGWSADFSNTEGYQLEDLLNGNGDQPYYSGWDIAVTKNENDLYEYIKNLTRRDETTLLYGLEGQIFRGITHAITIDNPSVQDFDPVEPVSWTGGTGQMLAINDVSAGTQMWIQLLSGIAPTDGLEITGGTSTATCDVDTTITSINISTPAIGASTGSAIIGAVGFGILVTDIDENSILTDLLEATQQKPSTGTAIVSGLVSTEDQVLLAEANGTSDGINFNQMAVNTLLSGAGETSVVIGHANGDEATIPADTPDTPTAGLTTIRIETDAGRYVRVEYTTHDSNVTFTIPSTSFSGDNASVGNNVFLGYMDRLANATSLSVDLINALSRTMFVRVRDGGVGKGDTPIVTFESPMTFTSTGGSSSVIRTTDL